jgi:PAS domain S-box-containing protein
MQIFTKRFGVLIGFVVMLMVLIANALTIRGQLSVQLASQNWVAHTRQVMLELAQTESLFKDAETGQRGFLYTGDPKYLAPYKIATTQIQQHLDNLQQLTRDNPDEQERVVALRNLAGKKLGELAQTISLAQSGKTKEARAIVVSDAGLFLMNDIRRVISEMRAEEGTLDAMRSASYQQSVRTTILCIYLATAFAALGLMLLAYYIIREMELRKKHARQLHEREEWFRVTLTSLGDAVIATDEQGDVTYLNPLAEELIGITMEHAKGRAIETVFPIFNEATHKPVENPVAKVVELGRVVGLANHTVLQNSDGSLIPIEDSAAPIRDANDNLIGVVLVFRDATQERKTQEILRESEKLASAARMSATVAHEINNPLEAIGNLIYLAKGTPGIPADATEHLYFAEQELERVSHITKQTLGFYRESKVPERIDVLAVVEYVLKLYSNKLKTKNIHIEREFGVCPPVKGLPGELKQAISNLISNAADAVSEHGTIWVKLTCIEEADGKFIRVVIEDDGPGISPEHVDRIFEPFFTTKKDVGTGLGLWVTKEIIDRHKGTIQIHPREESSLGGAIFNVLLPCDLFIDNPTSEDLSNRTPSS